MKKFVVIVVSFLLLSSLSFSQQQYGDIEGRVMDTEGNPLPGVNVTLQGSFAPRSAITSQNGHFRFKNVSPGEYVLKAELDGFKTYIQEDITIQIGTNINLSINMEQATLEEEITVKATLPVVDTKKTGISTSVSEEVLQELPSARDPWVIMQQVPGISSGNRVNVGGSESGQQVGPVARGNVSSSHQLYLDGVDITENASSGGGSPMYFDFDTFGEMQVVTGGKNVSFQTGGVAINMLTRRGGNNLEVMGRLFYTAGELQSDNLTEEAKELGYEGNRVKFMTDMGLQVGGPIIKDKLWFWAGWGQQHISRTTITGNPERTRIPGLNLKFNAQISPRDRMELSLVYTRKFQPDRGASATRPHETTNDMKAMNFPVKLEYEHIFSDNSLMSAKLHIFPRWWEQEPYGGLDTQVANDIVTGQWWDSYFSFGSDRPSYTGVIDGNIFVENLLGADHEFFFGVETRITPTADHGDCGGDVFRYFRNGEPYSARVYRGYRRDYNGIRYSGYISDTISIGRITLELGLRYDWEESYLKETKVNASRIAPELLPALTVGEIDPDLIWANFSPRVGFTYNLTGDGKTIIRANFARYANQLGAGVATHVSPTNYGYATYYWNDLNGDNYLQKNELVGYPYDGILSYGGFDPANPTSLMSPNEIDTDVNAPLTDEAIMGIEREVIKDLSISGNVILRRNHRFYWEPYIGITRDNYIGPFSGTESYGGETWSYEYWTLDQPRPAGEIMTQRPNYHENYSGVEFVLNKRLSNRWMMNTSFTYQNFAAHYGDGSYHDPTNIDNLDGAIPHRYFLKWIAKSSFLFQLPYNIDLSGVLNIRQGSIVPHEIVVSTPERAAVGLGSTMRIYTEDFDAHRLETFHMLDLRLSRDFETKKFGKITVSLDAFNVLNSNHDLARYGVQNSPRANEIESILNPRIFRIGIRFRY